MPVVEHEDLRRQLHARAGADARVAVDPHRPAAHPPFEDSHRPEAYPKDAF
jgi:hypothetical protein